MVTRADPSVPSQQYSGEGEIQKAMDHSGYVLVLAAAVLGGLALLLSILYGYIYCTKIKPRHRHLADDRINYYERDACVQYGAQVEGEPPERPVIKAHPFIVISYLSRMKTKNSNNPGCSTSAKRY